MDLNGVRQLLPEHEFRRYLEKYTEGKYADPDAKCKFVESENECGYDVECLYRPTVAEYEKKPSKFKFVEPNNVEDTSHSSKHSPSFLNQISNGLRDIGNQTHPSIIILSLFGLAYFAFMIFMIYKIAKKFRNKKERETKAIASKKKIVNIQINVL